MKKFLGFLKMIKDYLNGDFAYRKYLEHHVGKKVMDKNSFLRDRAKCKWDKVNRCC